MLSPFFAKRTLIITVSSIVLISILMGCQSKNDNLSSNTNNNTPELIIDWGEYSPKLNINQDFIPFLEALVKDDLSRINQSNYEIVDHYLVNPNLFDTNTERFVDQNYDCFDDVKYEESKIHHIISSLAGVYLKEKNTNKYSSGQLEYIRKLGSAAFKGLIDHPMKCTTGRWAAVNRIGKEMSLPLYAGFIDQQYEAYADWAEFSMNGWDETNGGGANGLDGVTANLFSLLAHVGKNEDGTSDVYRRGEWVDPYVLAYNETKRAYKFMAQRTTMSGLDIEESPRKMDPGLRADFSYFSHGPINMTHSYGTVLRSKTQLLLGKLKKIQYTNSDQIYDDDIDSLHKKYVKALEVSLKFALLSESSIYKGGGTYLLKGRGQTRAQSPAATHKPKGKKPSFKVPQAIHYYETLLATETQRLVRSDEELLAVMYGLKDFPDGDMVVKRTADYFMGVFAASKYTKSTEQHNNSNQRSTLIGKGAYDLRVYGDEYNHIQPIWNWDVLPGVTGYWSDSYDNGHNGKTPYGDSFFNGGLENHNSNSGIAAVLMDYKPRGHAKKSYFIFDNDMVCLGSDIYALKDNKEMATSLNQSLAFGDVSFETRNYDEGTLALGDSNIFDEGLRWVHHYGIGYLFPEVEDTSTVEIFHDEKSGRWDELSGESNNAANPNGPNQQDVFGLYIHHGDAQVYDPKAYAYVIKMNVTKEDIQAAADTVDDDYIITNTPEIQAVRHGNTIQIVFWEAGEYKDPSLGNSLKVAVNEPAYIQIEDFNTTNPTLYYSDPTETFNEDAEREVRVSLPAKGYQELWITGIEYATLDEFGKRTVTVSIPIE